MTDIDETLCRICLKDGAIYPIFESIENFESVYCKLAICMREKLEDLEGYPRNICLMCKNTSDLLCAFIAQYEKTCEILRSKLVKVEVVTNDDLNISFSEDEAERFTYELQLDNVECDKKVEKIDSSKLLSSLSHVTVKKIKLEDNLVNQQTDGIEDDVNGKDKKCQLKKGAGIAKAIAKKARPKATKIARTKTVKKAVDKPAVAKKAVGQPADPSKPGIAKSGTVDRPVGLDKTQKEEEKTNTVILCNHCGTTFSHKNHVRNHILRRHAERKIKCSKCPKQFVYISDFINHQRRHDNIRPYACDMCDKRFYDRKGLSNHTHAIHEKKKL